MFSGAAIRRINGQSRLLSLIISTESPAYNEELFSRLEREYGAPWEDSYGETYYDLVQGDIPAHVSEPLVEYLEGDGLDEDERADLEEEYPEIVGQYGVAAHHLEIGDRVETSDGDVGWVTDATGQEYEVESSDDGQLRWYDHDQVTRA